MIRRSLSLFALCAFSFLYAGAALAGSGPGGSNTLSEAITACKDYLHRNNYDTSAFGAGFPMTCEDAGPNVGNPSFGTVWATKTSGARDQSFSYGFATPAWCSAKPSQVGPRDNIGGKKCYQSCEYAPDSNPGDLSNSWSTYSGGGAVRMTGGVDWKPTGTVCGASEVLPIPPVLKVVCAESSCINGDLNLACAGTSTGPVCVSLDTPKPSACGSSGDTTICVGSPPPIPGNPPIADPPTQIVGSDNYQHNPGGGAPISNITVNNYNTTNNPPSNGGTEGPDTSLPPSKDPAPGDEPGVDKGSVSGGGDCATPPVCRGDGPTCAVVSQVWFSRCQGDRSDANGNGQPDWTEVKPGDGDPYDVTPTLVGDVFKTEAVDAGVLDSSGWVGNSCPALPEGGMLHMDRMQDFFCQWLALIRGIVIFCGFLAATMILARGKS